MPRASAMSDWMDAGIPGFLLAGPTQKSVDPVCSNSVAPVCMSSAPATSDRTTLVGKRDSR